MTVHNEGALTSATYEKEIDECILDLSASRDGAPMTAVRAKSPATQGQGQERS